MNLGGSFSWTMAIAKSSNDSPMLILAENGEIVIGHPALVYGASPICCINDWLSQIRISLSNLSPFQCANVDI